MEKKKKFACPCCGFLTLEEEPPGTHGICPVCGWEDDLVQFKDPTHWGANGVSLVEARQNFLRYGASEEKYRSEVRRPFPEEVKYPYHIEYTKFGSPVMRLPKEIELVTTFLLCDVQGPLGRTSFLSEIDRVLRGEVPYSEIAGNVCGLQIRKDLTRVIDTLADDETENACVIETWELRELMVIWCGLTENKA